MRNWLKQFIFGAFSISLLVLASCADADSSKTDESFKSGYEVSGTISLNGAAPSAFVSESGNSRVATSSFLEPAGWTIAAYSEYSENNGVYTAEESSKISPVSTSSNSFRFSFPSKAKYLITANLTVDGNVFFSGKTVVDVSTLKLGEDISIRVTQATELEQKTDVEGYGDINLKVYADSSVDVSKLSVTFNYDEGYNGKRGEWFEANINQGLCNREVSFLADGEEKSATIQIDDMFYGNYNPTFTFYNASGEVVYSCMETFNVYAEFTTDTWYGTSPYISGGKFLLTSAVLENVAKVEKFDYPVVLWNGIEKEYVFTVYSSDPDAPAPSYKIILDNSNPINYTRGAKLFSLNSNDYSISTSTLPLASQTPSFCFGNDSLYYLVGDTVLVYSKSYVGYAISDQIDLKEIVGSKTSLLTDFTSDDSFSINAITYYNGELYFSFLIKKSGTETHYFSKIEISSKEISCIPVSGITSGYSPSPIAVASVGDTQYLCYGSSFYGTPERTIKRQTFNFDTKAMGTAETLDVGYTVSDLQIIGSTLYATVYKYQNPISNPSTYKDAEKTIYNVVSTGGVVKIDLSGDFVLADWNSGTKYLGMYENYSYNSSGTQSESTEGMTPPKAQENQYFYGARKFIAKKPDELVIADDGAYCEIANPIGTDSVKASENKNRIVIVNLLNESMSVKDVNVSFSSTMSAGTGYGIN